MIKISFHTFGCKCNLSDSNSIALKLLSHGAFALLDAENEADVHIVNTCTVTSSADAQARNLIRKLDKSNNGSLMMVTGCSCRRSIENYEKLSQTLSGKNKLKVVDNLKVNVADMILKEFKFSDEKGNVESMTPVFRTRSFVKIQDGCNSFCSYCIVPFVRGKEKSRDLADVVNEIRTLESRNIKEIVLTGINVGNYKYGLEDLIEKILTSTSKLRIRLSSIRPSKVSDRLLGLMQEKRLCPHLHISLQSGSDKILELMNRHDYTTKDFVSVSQKFYEKLSHRAPFMTADVIVGFPCEKEEEFNETLRTLRSTSINKLHVFVFSPRPGTKAFDMKGMDNGTLIKERRDILLNFSDMRYKNSLKDMKGRTIDVLWEKDDFGHSENYYPVTGKGKANDLISYNVKEVDMKGLYLIV